MKNISPEPYLESQIQGWSECFESNFLFQQHPEICTTKQNPQSKPIRFSCYIQSYESNLKNLLDTYGESSLLQEFSSPKPYHQIQQQEEEKPEVGKRTAKVQKAGQYSKIYRQKKKEHMKTLEQENGFLKKKVDQLQLRIREKQMELNRIKFAAKKDEYDIQKLNEEMTKKLSLIADDKFESSQMIIEQKKVELIQQDKKMHEFLKFFQTYGLGGAKSRQLLQYYMNEFLQNVMRDREKYYFMKGIRKQNLKQYNTPLDHLLKELMEQSTEEEAKKAVKFYAQLSPLIFGIRDTCQELYQVYRKLMNILERTHDALKVDFSQSLELTKKRLRVILWFQQNQYRKQVRNLRAEWISVIKGEIEDAEETHHSKTKKKPYH